MTTTADTGDGPAAGPGPAPKPAAEPTPAPPAGETAREIHVNGHAEGAQNPIFAGIFNGYFNNGPRREPLGTLPVDLPSLPTDIHPFRHPDHDLLLAELQSRRIVLLTSYREVAAYAAAFSLVTDRRFGDIPRKAVFPARKRDRERPDLELSNLTNDEFLGKRSQILLIEINSNCTFFDSILEAGHGLLSSVRGKLLGNDSYVVLSIDESLVDEESVRERLRGLFCRSVSHLLYLLSPSYGDRAGAIEMRLEAVLGSLSERRQHYQRIADCLNQGNAIFEAFLDELEQAMHLTPKAREEKSRPIEADVVFANDSEMHRTAAFVAAYLPELNQRDFDRFVQLLLADETVMEEAPRDTLRRDGKLFTFREQKTTRWADRWLRDGDRVFRDCHLRTVVSVDGSWVIDFSEPYLRDELRTYLQSCHPWYLRRQCRRLQDSGVLFSSDLSPTAVDGLVQLFVERAVVDPAGFSSIWLLDLVLSARAVLQGEPPPESASIEDVLTWLSKKFAQEKLLAFFHERLTILIREMLSHDVLRDVVDRSFTVLMRTKQHDELLDVILELARRLRFVAEFEPLPWMRQILDQGDDAIKKKTMTRLVDLARANGPKIYEFLSKIKRWLPERYQPADRYSTSSIVALEFPFLYCSAVADTVEPGVWPPQHPLFYALVGNPDEARKKIGPLLDWILDARGAELEEADSSNALRGADAVRITYVADLIEHWAWVLEGDSETGPAEGRALFELICQEIESRISPRERAWLQRGWQRSQENQISAAANKKLGDRRVPMARKKKLEQLRVRFAAPPRIREI